MNEIREGAMKEVATIEFPRIDEDSKVSPDGSLIGIATGDGSIHLIDTKTWKLRLRLGGAYQRGRSFTFARDGRTLYSSRIDELWAWDTTSGERRFVRAGDHGDVLGVSERNHLFAVGSGPFDHLGQHIYSWDLTPSRPGHTMTPCTRVTGFGFSEDGRTFLRVERVRRWVKDDTVYTKPVEVVGFGQAVFGDEDPPPQKGYQVNNEDWVYDDNTTISLDLATGQTTRQKGYLPGIKVRPEGWMRLDQNNFSHATDSKAAPSKHLDRFGEVWTFDEDGDPKSAHSRATWLTNAKTQEKRRVPYDLPRQAIVLSPSPDGQSVLVASPNGSVELRDVWTGSLRATLTGHTSTVYEAIWSPDKQALATVSGDGTIKVWSMREPPIIGRWPGQHAAFTADGRSVLVYDRQRGDVAFRSQQTGQIERTATRPKDFNLNRLEVPDDGDLLVWRSSHELNARDRSNADKLALEYPAQSGTWYRPTVARNGRFAVVMKQVWNGMNGEQSRYKETLLRIDLSDRTERVLVELSDAGPQSREVWVHITSDSRQVVLAQYAAIQPPPKDGVVQSRQLAMKWTCYDAETKAVCWERTLPNDRLHWRTPDAPIHPSGRLAIVVGKDNTPRLYDLVSGDEKWQLPDWADTYTQTEFSPDGRWLATATEYGIVRILEVESGKSVATYDLRRAVPTARSAPSITELRFDLQGLRLAAGVRVGTSSESPTQVVVWNFVPEPPKTPARQ